MSDFTDQKIITLCDKCDCGECPTLVWQGDQVFIQDDFGGKVILTGGQWNLLIQLIEQKQFADWTFEPSSNQ